MCGLRAVAAVRVSSASRSQTSRFASIPSGVGGRGDEEPGLGEEEGAPGTSSVAAQAGEELGFSSVFSGRLVRSSYRADEQRHAAEAVRGAIAS